MLRFFLILLLLFFSPFPASMSAEVGIVSADAPAGGNAVTILIVGDSLSAGFGLRPGEAWPNLLKQRLSRLQLETEVVNASISGDTTRGALSRLPRALEVHAPDIVVIELGGNDGLRGFPIEVMRENLAQMVAMSRAAGARVLLLGMRLPPNYGPEYTEKFHQVYRDLAKDKQVQLVDFFLENVATNPELMQADGIHPTAAAQPVLLDNVWPKLKPLLPGTDARNTVDGQDVHAPESAAVAPSAASRLVKLSAD